MLRQQTAVVALLVLLNCSVCLCTSKPLVGNPAPDFRAVAVYQDQFQEVSLKTFKGKYVVLLFYPLDYTFVCPTELTAFSDKIKEFEKLDAQVLGVSVDSGLGELSYPLVSDLKKELSQAYGVLTDEGVSLRALFIIDKEGIVQHATINNLSFGRSVDETIRILQAVSYTQSHPDEVCPAGWTPGAKTMIPKPKESKDYFSSLK